MEDLAARRRHLEKAELDLKEDELALKRAKLAREMREEAAKETSSTIIKLNVGGDHIDTTVETLTSQPGSFFDGVLRDDPMLPGARRDSEGRLFLDRDSSTFRLVLEALRGSLTREEAVAAGVGKLIEEAQFFGLSLLEYWLRDEYNPHALSSVDQEMRRRAMDLIVRLAEDPAANADASLIDVFAEVDSFVFTGKLDGESDSIPRLFERQRREHGRRIGDGIAPTAAEFQQRLHLLSGGPLLEGLDLNACGLIVAGGIVLNALLLGDPSDLEVQRVARKGTSDIDLFCIAADEDSAQSAFQTLFNHLKRKVAESDVRDDDDDVVRQSDGLPPFTIRQRNLLVARTALAVTFVVGWPQRHIQLTLRRFKCVADVIYNFDIDSCQIAWTGSQVLATPSARRALISGVNVAEPGRRTYSYEARLCKYALRGFAVAVPGLQMERVSERYLHGAFTVICGELRQIVSFEAPADTKTRQKEGVKVEIGKPLVELPNLIVLSRLYGASDFVLCRLCLPLFAYDACLQCCSLTCRGCAIGRLGERTFYGSSGLGLIHWAAAPAPPRRFSAPNRSNRSESGAYGAICPCFLYLCSGEGSLPPESDSRRAP
jgi:hypothetical protein